MLPDAVLQLHVSGLSPEEPPAPPVTELVPPLTRLVPPVAVVVPPVALPPEPGAPPEPVPPEALAPTNVTMLWAGRLKVKELPETLAVDPDAMLAAAEVCQVEN